MDEKTKAILSRPTCSIGDVSEMLGLSRPAIMGAIERKELAATKIGTRYIIPTAPLRRMLHVEDAAVLQATAA